MIVIVVKVIFINIKLFCIVWKLYFWLYNDNIGVIKVKFEFKYVGIFFLVINVYNNVFILLKNRIVVGLILKISGIRIDDLNIVNKCWIFNGIVFIKGIFFVIFMNWFLLFNILLLFIILIFFFSFFELN